MNELLIPPAPNWYQFSVFECASDNTIVYGSRKDIFIINPRDSSESAHIQKIIQAHTAKILGISLNHPTWGNPEKLVASIGEDREVRLWDLNSLSLKMLHKEHEKNNEPLVGVSLVGDRVVSVSEKGVIVIWRLSTNKATKISDIFQSKVKVRCMSSCPHATWLTAFGLSGGLTIVADLRKCKVLYKMRGNEHDVTGLSWCPIPINIYKTEVGIEIDNIFKNKIKRNKIEETVHNTENDDHAPTEVYQSDADEHDIVQISETNQESLDELNKNTENVEEKLSALRVSDEKDDLLDVDIPKYNMDARKTQVYKKVDKKNPWGNINFTDPDTAEASREEYKSDFLKDCSSLRNLIESKDSVPAGAQIGRKILKVRDKTKVEDKENSEIEVIQASDIKQNQEHSEKHKLRTLAGKDDNVIESESADFLKLEVAEKHVEHSDCLKLDVVEKHETENISEEPEQIIETSSASETTENAFHTPENEVNAEELISKDYEKEYLLASAGKDGNVHIWRALTDGRVQLFLNTPAKQKKGKDNYRNKWIVVCWAKPDILLISTSTYGLYSWNLLPLINLNKPPSKQTVYEPRLVHQDHNSSIFSINVPYKIYSKLERTFSWNTLEEFFVWTFSKDKWILCTTMGTQRKTISSYPCLSSGVNCMVVSPIDPTKLAIGLYDCSLRIWDLSIAQTQVITMSKLVDNIQDKIMSIAWHPVKENCLAFSTSDGRVAQFMINTKVRISFHQYHRTIVHKIQWGPLPENEGEYALYSCSGGDLIYHDGTEPSAEPNKITLEKGSAQTFAWNADYSILAVGTKEGYVKLLSKNFEVYETFYMQKKAVQCVLWHPESTVVDSGRSPYANYLAVGTNETNIFIYNCRDFTEKDSGKKSPLVAVLEGHHSSVKSLGWCPQIGGRLVSGSEDGIVMVWNVITQTLLSSFRCDDKDNLGSLIWSPMDADLIIVGGRDHTIKIFRITKYPPVIYEPEKKEKKKSSSKSIPDNDDNDNECTVSSTPPEKTKKMYILPSIMKLQSSEYGDNVGTCRKILQMSEESSKNVEFESENDSSDEDSTTKTEAESTDNLEIDPSQLFGSRKDMIHVLNYEQQLHSRKNNWENMHNISLWRGNLATSIEKALQTGVIEPWIINMAPMVSHALWSKLCLKYAEKLVEDNRGLEASTYFLACHQTHKAIEAMCNCNRYIDALAVAKCRLLADDPIINEIYEQWASYMTHVGNYEVAAQCYIKLGRLSDAGVLLNKRAEQEKLELALELAKRSNNHDLEVAVNAKLELLNQQKQEICSSLNDITETESKYPVIKISESRFRALMASTNKKAGDEENATMTNEIESKTTEVASNEAVEDDDENMEYSGSKDEENK